MYIFESAVRYSEVDFNNKLNIQGVLNYFQDCCTFQSETGGVGMEALHARNLTWVLANWEIQVKRFPDMCEKIVTGTFPYLFKGCFGMRNFIMKDTDGNTLAMGDSLWTLIDYEKGTMASLDDELKASYVLEEKLPMEYHKGKIKIPGELKEFPKVKTLYHNLDGNMHANNGQLVQMGLDIVKATDMDKDYYNLRVEYRKQVRFEDELTPYLGKTEDGVVLVFKNQEDFSCTVMEFR